MEILNNKSDSHRIEITISSIDGLQKVDAPAFFYTRVHAKLEERIGMQHNITMPFRKPVWIIAMLVILLAANFFLLTELGNKRTGSNNNATETSTLQGFASEYGLNSSTAY